MRCVIGSSCVVPVIAPDNGSNLNYIPACEPCRSNSNDTR
jgi:hypothetical protein